MTRYEYKIVDVPMCKSKRGWFKRGKVAPSEFNMQLMNDFGNSGWDYVRRETLSSRRGGFFRRSAIMSNEVMVFRRPLTPVHEPTALAQQLRVEPVKVEPRRVQNSDLVNKVANGERKVTQKTARPTFPNLVAAH